jgi:hypothetical protein
MNNNFLKNGGRAVNNTNAKQSGILYNNGRGSGLQTNGPGDALGSIVNTGTDIQYPANVTPWSSPDTGDFSTILSAAIGAGRAIFTETDGTNSGTASFPDIGAAQANSVASGLWAGGVFTCPSGFVQHAYLLKQSFLIPLTFTLQSGALPPGLSLSQPDNLSFLISGTPTAVGTYDFVIRGTQGSSSGDAAQEITISADPDEGIGALLGGLRPC